MDKISVIVPVYNVEPYIRQCIDSIINQTYKNLEIILIDDGSPDRCGMICDEYAAKDKRIRVIHKQNSGVSAARNDGMFSATGEWTMFLDSDDWLEHDFIENMIAAVSAEIVDIIFAGGYILEFSRSNLQVYAFENQIPNWNGNEKVYLSAKILSPASLSKDSRQYATIATAWNKLFRTEFLQHSGVFFNTELHPQEDILFCLDVVKKAMSFRVTRNIGYHYRQEIETSALHRFNPGWPHMADVFLPQLESHVSNWSGEQILQEALDGRVMTFVMQILKCYYFHPQNEKSRKEIAQELDRFKSVPVVKHAIWTGDNKIFTKRQNVLRYALRLPWIFPVKMLWRIIKRR